MKFFTCSIATAALMGAVSLASPTSAQEHQGCFLIDESGVLHDLAAMCDRPVISNDAGFATGGSSPSRSAAFQSGGSQGALTPSAGGSTNDSDFGRTSFGGDGGLNAVPFGSRSSFRPSVSSGGTSNSSGNSGGGSGGSGGCNFPGDRAADGSLCGGRAASVRSGGR